MLYLHCVPLLLNWLLQQQLKWQNDVIRKTFSEHGVYYWRELYYQKSWAKLENPRGLETFLLPQQDFIKAHPNGPYEVTVSPPNGLIFNYKLSCNFKLSLISTSLPPVCSEFRTQTTCSPGKCFPMELAKPSFANTTSMTTLNLPVN